MTTKRVWLGLAGALVLAFGLAVACYADTLSPRFVPAEPDTTADSTKHQG